MKGSKGVKGRREGTRGPGKNILGSILYLHRGSLRGASCQVIEVKSLALGGFWRQLPIFFGSWFGRRREAHRLPVGTGLRAASTTKDMAAAPFPVMQWMSYF